MDPATFSTHCVTDRGFRMLKSTVKLGRPMQVFTGAEVKEEPMLFNCSLPAAFLRGGPVTRAFLRAFRASSGIEAVTAPGFVVDTRVHMLMPGMYPCIPGWHHDDVPRTRSDGQPDYVSPPYRSCHAMALAGDPVAPTEFALGSAMFKIPALGRTIYADWHEVVERHLASAPSAGAKMARGAIEAPPLTRWTAPMHRLIGFDDRSWHRGVMATSNGWRWFGRVSWNTERAKQCTNEVRKQTQVYLSAVDAGW